MTVSVSVRGRRLPWTEVDSTAQRESGNLKVLWYIITIVNSKLALQIYILKHVILTLY